MIKEFIISDIDIGKMMPADGLCWVPGGDQDQGLQADHGRVQEVRFQAFVYTAGQVYIETQVPGVSGHLRSVGGGVPTEATQAVSL